MNEEDSAELIERRAPSCGILSIAAPFISLLVLFFAEKAFRFLYPDDNGWLSGIAFMLLPAFGCILGGIILAGVAAWRNERYSALPWIGFLFNTLPILCGMVASR